MNREQRRASQSNSEEPLTTLPSHSREIRADDPVEAARAAADAFCEAPNTPWDTNAARDLERRLALLREPAWVEKVRARRVQGDRESAREYLSSACDPDPRAMLELSKNLRQCAEVGLARRLLVLACKHAEQTKHADIYAQLFQQAAVCTYKDPDLPLEWRLERAFKVLECAEDLARTRDPESLGIAGAIFKRKWEDDGKRQNLERALYFYLRGYALGAPDVAPEDLLAHLRDNPNFELNAERDRGYNGINAAFVLELLAEQEEREAQHAHATAFLARERRKCATDIRREIVRSVPRLLEQDEHAWLTHEWWIYATIGEAFFGLQDYSAALEWLVDRPTAAGMSTVFGREVKPGLRVPEWETESTARQLARIARSQFAAQRAGSSLPLSASEAEFETSEAAKVLEKFLGGDKQAVLSSFRGKFGLGLSGGGFRAALFHIGVLARLSELDLLRHVEVLSCVSGGSIVGAYYYLEVRQLMQTKTDDEITSQDYVDIVARIEEQFVLGVQRNIRTRVLAELRTNLKLMFSRGYSRTARVGELYERELYSRVRDHGTANGPEGPVTGPHWLPDSIAKLLGFRRDARHLSELLIAPLEKRSGQAVAQPEFNPRAQNWHRKHKVPVLVLNATCLNTGHNWQFTATYMGEPPLSIHTEIDCNYRLRRLYYRDAPPGYPKITLGQAVAASSCVPGLFEPLVLDDLYPDTTDRRISVRLVDGGVCDNQGISSLLENDCSVMLVSDGSGQMDAQDAPAAGIIGVPLRSNSILQARLREAEYGGAATRKRANLLQGFMFVHLKQDLAAKSVAWRECPPDQKRSDVYDDTFDAAAEEAGMTRYHVAREIQQRLAGVRTDLDSFADAEAYALMASGYLMTARHFRSQDPALQGLPNAARNAWKFLQIEPCLQPRGPYTRELAQLLDVAANTAFKPWRLSPTLRVASWVLLLAALSAAVWTLATSHWSDPWRVTFDMRSVVKFALWSGGLAALGIVKARFERVGHRVVQAIRWRETLRDWALGIGMSTLGWWIARVHLHVFDRLYLRRGRIRNFVKG